MPTRFAGKKAKEALPGEVASSTTGRAGRCEKEAGRRTAWRKDGQSRADEDGPERVTDEDERMAARNEGGSGGEASDGAVERSESGVAEEMRTDAGSFEAKCKQELRCR